MSGLVKSTWNRLMRYFLAGVFAVLPLVITVAIVAWVANFLQAFIGPDTFLGKQLSNLGVAIGKENQFAQAFSYLFGWIVVLAAVFALGVFIESGAKRFIRKIMDTILHRTPVIGSIYKTSQQVVEMLDTNNKEEADLKGMTAVFCKFGEGAGVLALLVSPDRFAINGRDFVFVMIPTAPVPFGGGLVLMHADSVTPADMTVDSLMSIYVSMGVTAPQFMKVTEAKS